MKIQLEYGTTATAYTNYEFSEAFVPVILRSLPNGVADEFDVTTGKHTQRIKQKTLSGEEDWRGLTDLGDTLRSYADNVLPDSAELSQASVICNILSFSMSGVDEKGFYVYDDTKRIGIKIPKSELSTHDIDGIKQWVAENAPTLSYQLAQPIIKHYPFINVLNSYPKGTICIETRMADATLYDEIKGFEVDNISTPIKNLLKVEKYEIVDDNAVITDIDLSTCTIALDGLSFTSTQLSHGDVVWASWEYDSSLTTIPTTVTTLPLNLKAQVESNNKAILKNSKQINVLNAIKADKNHVHQYGNRFEWIYNSASDCLELVVIDS